MNGDTHRILPDCEENGRKRKAVCGAFVYMHQHSAKPTCPECQLWNDAEEETVESRFGPEPPPQTKPKTFDDWPDMTGGHARNR